MWRIFQTYFSVSLAQLQSWIGFVWNVNNSSFSELQWLFFLLKYRDTRKKKAGLTRRLNEMTWWKAGSTESKVKASIDVYELRFYLITSPVSTYSSFNEIHLHLQHLRQTILRLNLSVASLNLSWRVESKSEIITRHFCFLLKRLCRTALLYSVSLAFPIHKTFHPSVATPSKPKKLYKFWIISVVSNKKENIWGPTSSFLNSLVESTSN